MRLALFWSMRTQSIIITVLTLHLIGCGSDSSGPAATPAPTVAPVVASPTPTSKAEASCSDSALVGNWIDAKSNSFKINADCSAQAGSQKLDWSLNEKNEAVFTSNSLPVDVCAYEVLSQGGLTEALKVTLQMICQKGGSLSYSKSS